MQSSSLGGPAVWQRKKLLIWGKTYPEFSKKYHETVCTGAIDAEAGRLLRIYPIQLRYMKDPFKTYDWIEAEVEKNTSDCRPESYRIQQDSIKVVGHIDTKDEGWAERARLIITADNVFPSVKALQEAQDAKGTSLGLVKPCELDFGVQWCSKGEREEWEARRDQARRQKELFVDEETVTKQLQFIPVRYVAKFKCMDSSCPQLHQMRILDWGTCLLGWKQYLASKSSPKANEDVISKLKEYTDSAKRDSYFFMGNTLAYPKTFTIVGLFYPPISATKPKPKQLSLLP